MYDAIYLSPHLDDATLSCGGQIHRQTAAGQSVLIVTVMAGDPPAQAFSSFAHSLHEQWQLTQEAVAARRAEDEVACRILGAEHHHGLVPDCIYRLDPETETVLYEDWPAVIGPIHDADQALIKTLTQQFRELPPAKRIIAPLAAGRHVDHRIVRLAAEASLGLDLIYFEDYPYVRDSEALAAVIPPGSERWAQTAIALSPENLEAKIEAIAAYDSQLSTFFNGRADMEFQIRQYAQTVGGERLWQKRP